MQYTFVPVAFEIFGSLNKEGPAFLSETGSRFSSTTGDTRETSFLLQSLSTMIQRFNAVVFQGTMSRLPETNKQRLWFQDRPKSNVDDE